MEAQEELSLDRVCHPMSNDEEDSILKEILEIGDGLAASRQILVAKLNLLEDIAREPHAPSLVRCAALDKWVMLWRKDPTKPLALGDLLRTDDEAVRAAAHQWAAWLEGQRERETVTRGIRNEDLRRRAAADPSPRIRWLSDFNH